MVKLEPDFVEKPLRRLRQLLKEFPADPPPEDVHRLRTQTRRREAMVDALTLGHNKKARGLLKAITPLRKAAGKVRDMDVLIEDVLMLFNAHEEAALIRLVETLSKMRSKSARKLNDLVDRQRNETRKRLKESSELLKRKMGKMPSESVKTGTAPQMLVTELSHWPDLDEANLHPFRIRVKELLYMLQLSTGADGGWVFQLGEVKDAIGEWHDWTELLKMATKILDARRDKELLARMEAIGKKRFQHAVTTANATRKRYFHMQKASGEGQTEPRKAAGKPCPKSNPATKAPGSVAIARLQRIRSECRSEITLREGNSWDPYHFESDRRSRSRESPARAETTHW